MVSRIWRKQVPPVTISIKDAARAIGIGRTKLYELINSGELQVLKIGRRTLVSAASIKALVSGGQQ
jgi:excisionase family DNA binding protein